MGDVRMRDNGLTIALLFGAAGFVVWQMTKSNAPAPAPVTTLTPVQSCAGLPAPPQGQQWAWNGFSCVLVPTGAIAL